MTEQPTNAGALAKVPFDNKLESFTGLAESRANLKKDISDLNNQLAKFRRDNNLKEGSNPVVYKKYIPSEDKDVVEAAKSEEHIRFLDGIYRYREGLNKILLTKFPGLGEFIGQVIEEYEARTKGVVDEEATEKLKNDYLSIVESKDQKQSELEDVLERIDNIKEFIDVADKVSNIGSRVKGNE